MERCSKCFLFTQPTSISETFYGCPVPFPTNAAVLRYEGIKGHRKPVGEFNYILQVSSTADPLKFNISTVWYGLNGEPRICKIQSDWEFGMDEDKNFEYVRMSTFKTFP